MMNSRLKIAFALGAVVLTAAACSTQQGLTSSPAEGGASAVPPVFASMPTYCWPRTVDCSFLPPPE